MVATTNAIAKIAAVVAGLGLVAMSFASFAAPAKAATADELQAQINALLAQIAAMQGGSMSGSTTFTMDLTLGSTGAEVTALQQWLISKGYSIPAGATGYFGAQTQSALAAWQAANGVSPAAGYFGPITRAKVNAMAGGSTGSTGGTTTGGLSGGEANLHNFDLVGGEDLREADSNVEIALAKFDVDGGDARIQRVTVDVQAVSNSYSQKPWDYIDSLSVYDGNKKIGSVDTGSKGDWDKQDDDSDHNGLANASFYTIDIPVDGVISEGDKAELSIRADAVSQYDGTDVNQTFKLQVPTDGVRAVDSKGIQQYTGDGEEVTLGFDSALNGDLTVKKSSNTPTAGTLVGDTNDTSDEFDVLAFEIKNSDSADSLLTDLTVTVATGTSDSVATDVSDIIRKATLTVDGDTFDGDINADGTIDFTDMEVTLAGDDTTKFTLSIELFGQSTHWQSTGQTLTFSVASGNVTAEGSDTGDAASVSGTATGFAQGLAVDGGINVEGNSMSTSLVSNNTVTDSYGTFTLKYDVTALGDDVYIPKAATTTGTTGSGIASSTYAGAVVLTSMSASTTNSAVTVSMTTTADSDNTYFYVVHDGDTETFTVVVTINPSGTSADLNSFQVGLDKVKFSSTDSNLNSLQVLDVDQTDSDFHTDPLVVQG